MNSELAQAIKDESARRGADPLDFATLVGFETGGTFDIWQKGPRTKWGQHVGLIQMGEPQRRQFGYTPGITPAEAVKSSFDYLEKNGWRPGMSLLDMYSTINAGAPGRYNAVDGGTTVRQKVESSNMQAQRRKAAALLGGEYTPIMSHPTISSGMGAEGDVFSTRPELPTFADKTPYVSLDTNPYADGQHSAMGDALHTDQTIPYLVQRTKDMLYGEDQDPNFFAGSARIESDLKARGLPIDNHYAWDLTDSTSEKNYGERLARAEEDHARLQRLEQAGIMGTAARTISSMLDPVQFAGDVAGSALLGPEFMVSRRATRFGRIVADGIGGLAGGTASAAVVAANNPNYDASDVAFGAAMGLGVGGLVGALRGNPATVLESTMLQRAGQNHIAHSEGLAPLPGSVGAAKAVDDPQFLKDGAYELIQNNEFDKTFGAGWRFSLSAKMQATENPVEHSMAGLVNDGAGKVDGAINSIAASEEATRFTDVRMARKSRFYHEALREFFKDNQVNWAGKAKAEEDFNRQVSLWSLSNDPDRDNLFRASVVRMGKKFDELYAEQLKLSQNPFMYEGLNGRAVMGMDEVKSDGRSWMPRYWDTEKVRMAIRDFGEDAIVTLFGRAMKSADTAVPDAVIERAAKGFVRAIRDRAHGLDDVAHRVLGDGNLDALKRMLMDDGGVAEADADALLSSFKKSPDRGRDAHAKQRVLLDEDTSMQGLRHRLGHTADLKLTDLMDLDASSIYQRYTRSQMGRVALARYRFKDPKTGEVIVNGITSDGEYAKIIDLAKQKNAELLSQGRITKAQAAASIERMEFAYSAILGRPLNGNFENTTMGAFLRGMRKFNFIRIMNQSGFSNLGEFAMIPASLGVKHAFTSLPALRRMVNQDGEEMLRSGLFHDIEDAIGIGTSGLREAGDYHFDELTGLHDDTKAGWGRWVDRKLNQGSEITTRLSLIRAIETMQERMAGASVIQKFADMAQGAGGLSAKRLADLGLDTNMTDRILKMFNEPGNFYFEKGALTGRKVTRAYFEKWSDKEAREAFLGATRRMVNQLIQRNDIGNLAPWMSIPWARTILQFRMFNVASWDRQTMKALNMRDAMAAKQIAMSAALASMVYIAQKKLLAIGRSDKEEFEDKNLNWKAIAEGAVGRTAAFSLIPMIVDTMLPALGQEQMFSGVRSSGQANDVILGNPTGNFTADVQQFGAGIASIFSKDGLSQQGARNIARVFPFQNFLPITVGLNAGIRGLPEYTPRDRKKSDAVSIFGH